MRPVLTIALMIAAAGCDGTFDMPKGGAAFPGLEGSTTHRDAALTECVARSPSTVLPTRVRRLSQSEYQRSVEHLLGGPVDTGIVFPPNQIVDGYDNDVDVNRVTGLLTSTLFDGVGALAQRAASSVACADDACARAALDAFAARAYRRPLSDEERSDLSQVYDDARTDADPRDALAAAYSVVLQSPEFLYVTELGEDATSAAPGSVVVLTAHEIAAELSYLFTGAPADAALRRAADTGAILDPDERERQALRLIQTDAARAMFGKFAAEWAEVASVEDKTKDATAFPEWSQLKAAIAEETRSFVSAVILSGTPRDLFTADWTVAPDSVVTAFGLGPKGADGRSALPPGMRAGILTQRSVLAAHAGVVDDSPIKRGHFVRSRLLCQPISPPAPTLQITETPTDPTLTVRERVTRHTSGAACQGCHSQMNPIGFGFSGFDAIGQQRATDRGKPVDATGKLEHTDVDADFDGLEALGALLAESEQARACFAEQWFRFAHGTALTTESERYGFAESTKEFTRGEQPILAMILSLVRSDMFTTRCKTE